MSRRPYNPEDHGHAPHRELDREKSGERAKAPPSLIRKPLEPPPMKPVRR